MMTGMERSPGIHQPRKGIPSCETNSAGKTEIPTASGVVGPGSGKWKWLFVIRKEPATGSTRNRTSAIRMAAKTIGIAEKNCVPRPGQQRGEGRLEIRQLRVVVGMVPVEVDHERDLGAEPVDGAIALIHLGDHPVARAGFSRRQDVVIEEPPENPTAGKLRPLQPGDEQRRRPRR